MKNILLIHSYHPSFEWTQNITQGIDSAFLSVNANVHLTVEFLDSKRKFDDDYQQKIKNVLEYKFSDNKFDVIIVADDDALDFILDHGEEMFPGVPVVFCGINDFYEDRTRDFPQITGVLEKVNFTGTINLALELFPQTKKVVVVGDRTRTGLNLAQALLISGRNDFPELDFFVINDLSLDEVFRVTEELVENSIIVLLPFTTEISGKTLPHDLVVRRLSEQKNTPVFGLWDFMFPHGTLGGRVVSGFQQGFEAGKIAVRIFNGEQAREIDIIKEIASPIYIDHTQLKRFGIPRYQIPEGSVEINQPEDFFSRNMRVILLLLGFLFISTLLMVGIYFYQQKIKLAIAGELQFRNSLMNSLPTPLYYTDSRGIIMGCNNAFEKHTGWKKEKALWQSIVKILPFENQKWFGKQIEEAIQSGEDQTFEAKIINAAGRESDAQFFQSVFYDQQNKPVGIIGNFFDTTLQKQNIETIRLNEERYSLVVQATRDGIWDIHIDNESLFVALRWKEIFGYRNNEMPVSFNDWVHMVFPQHRTRLLRKVAGLIKQDYPNFEMEIQMRHKTLGYIWVYVHAYAVFDSAGRLSRVTGSVSDIQKRKSLEMELGRWQDIFNHTQMGVVVGEPHSPNMVMMNPAFAQMHGYSVEELTGRTISTVFAPGHRDAIISHAQKQARTNGHHIFEADHITKDGRIFPAMIDVTSVKNDAGTELYRIVNCQDISLRKLHQKELLHQKNYVSNIMETSPVGIAVVNNKGDFIFANNAAIKVFGFTLSKVKDLSFHHPKWNLEDYNGNPFPKEKLPVSLVLATKKAVAGVRHTITVEGCRKKYLLVNAAPLLNEKGEVESVVCAIQDVSKQYQLELEKTQLIEKEKSLNQDLRLREEELKKTLTKALELKEQVGESEKRYKDFINASGDLVYLKDYLQRFLLVNQSFAKFSGKTREEIIGNTIQEVIPGSLGLSLLNLEQKVLATNEMLEDEVEHNGSTLRVRMFPVLNPNSPTCVGVVLRDITLGKQNIKLKENIEIARHSAAIKQQFLANMSHEIRTPMNGIMGMIEFMCRTSLSDEQKSYVETLKNSSDTLLGIINDILDFSKIEAGKMTLFPSSVDLRQLAGNMKNLFSALSFQTKLDFLLDIDPLIPDFILTDRVRLTQILTNLISNAVKFTHHGSVTLKIKLKERKENDLVILVQVKDTGIGISTADQQKLFSAFTQIDNSFTRVKEGTGLGLSICHSLVQLMGGEIGIISNGKSGSTFWFTIKVQECDGNPVVTPVVPVATSLGAPLSMNVLLVEDKAVNQKVVKMMLTNLGCVVTLANNGLEALEKVKSSQSGLDDNKAFDLIFMDIQMPVMDGLQATRILRDDFTNIPPIVGLSANVVAAEAEMFFKTGMDDFLLKPVKTEDIRRVLLKWHPDGQKI